jgi:hypothetical protein
MSPAGVIAQHICHLSHHHEGMMEKDAAHLITMGSYAQDTTVSTAKATPPPQRTAGSHGSLPFANLWQLYG